MKNTYSENEFNLMIEESLKIPCTKKYQIPCKSETANIVITITNHHRHHRTRCRYDEWRSRHRLMFVEKGTLRAQNMNHSLCVQACQGRVVAAPPALKEHFAGATKLL